MNRTTLIIAEGTNVIDDVWGAIKEIVIPDGVTSIGKYAFDDCLSLTEITIPDSVTSIGDGAFLDCVSLKEIVIPSSVNSVGKNIFFGCSSLESIYIDKERGSLILSYRGIPETTKVYWKGEWDKERKNE